MNPGGPGVPAQDFAQLVWSTLSDASERFDVIGLDGRGTGESEPFLNCSSAAEIEQNRQIPLADLDQQTAWYQGQLDRCRSLLGDEVVAQLGTIASARDLDAARAALGEPMISFLGVSYGTRLGEVYATLFPTRVAAMVLDSVVSPEWPLVPDLRGSAAAMEVSLSRFFELCGASAACAFHGGQGTDAVRSAFDALWTINQMQNGFPLVRGGQLSSGDFFGIVLAALYTAGPVGTLGSLLADAEAGALPDRWLDAADRVAGKLPSGEYETEPVANQLISCNDGFGPGKSTRAEMEALISEVFAGGARISGYPLLSYPPCGDLPGLPPPIALSGRNLAPKIYIINGLHDPVTPASNAMTLQSTFGNDSWLDLFEREGHAMYDSQEASVRVSSYLLSPSTPPGPFSCQNIPPTKILRGPVRVFGRASATPAGTISSTHAITMSVLERAGERELATVTSTVLWTRSMVLRTDLTQAADIFVRASVPGVATTELYLGHLNGAASAQVSLVSQSFWRGLRGFDPLKAQMQFLPNDCAGLAVSDVVITTDDQAARVVYGRKNAQGACAVNAAAGSTADGCRAIIYNLTPGPRRITMTKGANSWTFDFVAKSGVTVYASPGPR